MIIARAIGDGTELLLLGISRRNIEELQAGRPIRLTTETHGAGIPLGWTIAIIYGETEAAITADLQAMGVIGPDTKVSAQPRDPKPPRQQ
jgi:hypothetical protein